MKVMNIAQSSEAEEYFLNELIHICEDKVSLEYVPRLSGGTVCQYTITDEDYMRLRNYISQKKGA